MIRDPECVRNLAGEASRAGVVSELRIRMEAMLREEGDPRMNGGAAFYDTIRYVGPDPHRYSRWERFHKP